LKKYLLSFLLGFSSLYGLESQTTLRLYESLFHAFVHKPTPLVYVTSGEYEKIFKQSKGLHLTEDLTQADIVLVTDESMFLALLPLLKKFQKKPIVFGTQRKFLQLSPLFIGTLYWKKGRVQLRFLSERLKRANIVLPEKFQRYILEK